MANHTLFLLNNSNKKLTKSIKELRACLLANQVVRIQIGNTLGELKKLRSHADMEGDTKMVSDLHRYINALRKELARQVETRRQTVNALTMLGENLVHNKSRIQEELADVSQA
ncbi:MAG: hypothetical protein ACRCTP_02210 [Aeromonas popoffii]|uniref:hypothetical protein n=1 Tax=Aeromonas popoffii TaxID=70856 RepID=UPI003F35B38A